MIKPKDILIKHRSLIKKIVYDCVSQNITLSKEMLKDVPKKDQTELFDHIQMELTDLHDGQLVRFNLLLSQFRNWKKSLRTKK